MSKGKGILLIFIVIFGGIIAFLSYNWLSVKKTNIYVFNADYEDGTKLKKDMFEAFEVDNALVEAQSARFTKGESKATFLSKADINKLVEEEEVLAVQVFAGQPVTSNLYLSTSGSTVERRLSDGHTAITIPVNNITGVSSEVSAGSRINIYNLYSINTYNVVQLMYQNVKILDVQKTGNKTNGYTISAFTIEVKPEDALQLLYAIQYNQIRVSLLKPGTYQTTNNCIYKINTQMLELELMGNNSSGNGLVSTGSSTSNNGNGNEVTNSNNQQNTTIPETTTSTVTDGANGTVSDTNNN